MWDGLLLLVLLCVVMAASSFLVGMLPLYFSLSSRQLRMMSALGTGVLVGVALIIIIPEGVETLYTASGEGRGTHSTRALSMSPRAIRAAEIFSPAPAQGALWRREELEAIPGDIGLSNGADGSISDISLEEVTVAQELERQQADDEQSQPEPDDTPGDDAGQGNSRDPHAWVGLSLITGFILMYLIDTLPRRTTSQPRRRHISLNNISFNNTSPTAPMDAEAGGPPAPLETSQSSSANTSRPSSTTTGLVIHACADGIALGASSTTTSSLTFIIFFALIIHKAPAAFGLTSVLLKQGLSKRMARTHLIVFSLAAPTGALITWAAAHMLGYSTAGSSSSMSTEFATGVLLLFSGGTFLYVATHTIQDSGHDHGSEVQMNGFRGISMSDMYESSNAGAVKGSGKKVGLSETGLTVLGMLVPLLFQFEHGH